MVLDHIGQWHPYEACEVFKRTHDSREVEQALKRLAKQAKP
jgi:hypothetical protein